MWAPPKRRRGVRVVCRGCGFEFEAGSGSARWCPTCRPRVRQPKASTTARGYGAEHQKARKLALARLTDGDPCARCGGPMYRDEAAQLDLDHADDRRSYRGLAHASCNRAAGARKTNGMRRGLIPGRPFPKPSREW